MNGARWKWSFRWKGTVQSQMVLQEMPTSEMLGAYAGLELGSSG